MRIRRYELGRVLGTGGMGTVYEATARGPAGLGRVVALKVLHKGTEALRREARIGGLLRHPHLVDVFELGEHDGTWFCAMELCDGGTIAAHLPLSPRAVIDVGLQVCSALAYAHEELGLVHLDLKPQNLLLDGATVKVADLGVSRVRGDAPDGRVRGTAGYMAPEQLAGGAVDARTDIYALGVVLHELSTGSRDRASATFDLDAAEDASHPVSRGLGDALDAVVRRCTEREPDRRYASMDELAAALRAVPVSGLSLRETLGRDRAPRARAAPAALGPEENVFVGRAAELEAVARLLEAPGVYTLKGPGGIGKTRLARAAARAYAHATGRPALFCDLSAARTREEVVFAVASALEIPPGRAQLEALAAQVGHAIAARGPMALVADTFEHLREAADLLVLWRHAAPEARFVVTSREPLRCEGEVVTEVAPLADDAAVALLVARARERGAEVARDPALAELARRLDGLPLALELAAGRIGVLSPAEVLERLGMSLLRSGRAEASDREATLRGALDWSFELLAPDEKRVLADLSVFRGGFSAEGAEAVVRAEGPVVDVLDALHDRSLLVVRDGRLRLLEPLREYASEKLVDPAEAEARHGRWFAQLGREDFVEGLERHGGVERRRALALDVENLFVAAERAIARGDAPTTAGALRACWAAVEYQGPYQRVLELAQRALAADGRLHVADVVAGSAALRLGRMAEAEAHLGRAGAKRSGSDLANLGVLSMQTGRYAAAREQLEASLAALRASGDRRNEGLALGNLGILAGMQGRWEDARALLEAALAVHREVGDRALEGLALGNLGLLHQETGDVARATACYAEALAVHREVGSRQYEAMVTGNLAGLERERGAYGKAAAHLEAARRLARQAGSHRDEAIALANLGRVQHESGRTAEAGPTYEAALERLRAVKERRFEGLAEGNFGRLLCDQGRYDEARAHLEVALAIHRELQSPADEAITHARLALVAARSRSFDEAGAKLGEADRALAGRGRPRDRAELALVRAEIASLRGEGAGARAALDAAEAERPPAWIAEKISALRRQDGIVHERR